MSKPAPSDIEKRAYQIWEREGRPHGRDHDHWLNAEREILGAATAAEDRPIGEIRSAAQASETAPAPSRERQTGAAAKTPRTAAKPDARRATTSSTPRDRASTAGASSPQAQAGQSATGPAQQSAGGGAQSGPGKADSTPNRKPRGGS